MPDFSPAQPWRAETRLIPCNAAAPRLTPRFTFHASRFTVPLSEARTKLAEFFSILQDRGDSGSEERARQLQTTRS